jgi:hypothetical protein
MTRTDAICNITSILRAFEYAGSSHGYCTNTKTRYGPGTEHSQKAPLSLERASGHREARSP